VSPVLAVAGALVIGVVDVCAVILLVILLRMEQ
jgi:hypothetical protein